MVKAVDVFRMTAGDESKKIFSTIIVASENQPLTQFPSKENRDILRDLGISTSLESDILSLLNTSGFISKSAKTPDKITFSKAVREAAMEFLESKPPLKETMLHLFAFYDRKAENKELGLPPRLRIVAYENNPFSLTNIAEISPETANRFEIPNEIVQSMNKSFTDVVRARNQVLDTTPLLFYTTPEEMNFIGERLPSIVINIAMTNTQNESPEDIKRRNKTLGDSIPGLERDIERVRKEYRNGLQPQTPTNAPGL